VPEPMKETNDHTRRNQDNDDKLTTLFGGIRWSGKRKEEEVVKCDEINDFCVGEGKPAAHRKKGGNGGGLHLGLTAGQTREKG